MGSQWPPRAASLAAIWAGRTTEPDLDRLRPTKPDARQRLTHIRFSPIKARPRPSLSRFCVLTVQGFTSSDEPLLCCLSTAVHDLRGGTICRSIAGPLFQSATRHPCRVTVKREKNLDRSKFCTHRRLDLAESSAHEWHMQYEFVTSAREPKRLTGHGSFVSFSSTTNDIPTRWAKPKSQNSVPPSPRDR
jgi:hypothetical protein